MSSDQVIKCESLYKIFGANAKRMLQNHSGNVDAAAFQKAGCIVGAVSYTHLTLPTILRV